MSDILLTSVQMRALEDAAIASGAVTGLELMERAGAGAVTAIRAEWPELGPGSRAVVLCGPGNNGGDGFVVARLLRERGWAVECYLHGDPETLPPDARVNYERWAATGPVGALRDAPRFGSEASLFVDALFGTGLTRPLSGEVLDWAADRVSDREARRRTVALDLPSGLCGDSGRELGDNTETVMARLTVTFHSVKPGQVLAWGPVKCGRLEVVDIGLTNGRPAGQVLVTAPPVTGLAKADPAHKFDHGHALVLAGGVGKGGAGRLAARAALRIGAGLVTVAPPPAALIENACHLDAIMLRAVRDGQALAGMLEDDRIGALCLGPGLGSGTREAGLVAAALAGGRATVLDGDALTLLAGDGTLRDALHEACVLTPHMGEFARLAPDLAERVTGPVETGPAYSRLDAARALAARLGVTVLLKGSDTVIARPDGRAAIHAAAYGREAPWLATAGAGDVLAGLIAGLLARGLDPMAACEAAAWLHVEAARSVGPGLISEDLPEAIPAVLRKLGA